ncbi:MAG: Serine/threonine-protein kinase pkn1, partial [Planctomycetota bacterium]
RYGLRLPTEDEWEYGCRGGTTTPWQVGLEALRTVANFCDLTAKKAGAQWGVFENWEDGHVVHAPVGRFIANAYGLHDMHGNVSEWCGDMLQTDAGAPDRALRGGGFVDVAQSAQSSNRFGYGPTYRIPDLGLRPARTSRF